MDVPASGRTLLVGEGDFSFCVAMVNKLPDSCHGNIIATSLETDTSIQKHRDALHHVDILRQKGVTVLLNTDATKLHENPNFCQTTFARIIFNFPHAGGKSNHKKNRKLLRDFFSSARQILDDRGQIFMTLCKGQGGTPADKPQRAWHDSWQVVSMAADAGLILVKVLPFYVEEYTVYSSTGFRSQDKGFNTENAVTHIFETAEMVEIPQSTRVPVLLNNKVYTCPRYLYTKLRSTRFIGRLPNHPLKLTYQHLVQSMSTDSQICDLGMLKPLTPCSSDSSCTDPHRLCLGYTQEKQEINNLSALTDTTENFDSLVDTVTYLDVNKQLPNPGNVIDNCNEVSIDSDKSLTEGRSYCVRHIKDVAKVVAEKLKFDDSICIAFSPVILDSDSSPKMSSPYTFSSIIVKHCSGLVKTDTSDCDKDKVADNARCCNNDYIKSVVETFAEDMVNRLNSMLPYKANFELYTHAISQVICSIKTKTGDILSIGAIRMVKVSDDDGKTIKVSAKEKLCKTEDTVIDIGALYFVLTQKNGTPFSMLVCSLDLYELSCGMYDISDSRLVYSTDYRVSDKFEKLHNQSSLDETKQFEKLHNQSGLDETKQFDKLLKQSSLDETKQFEKLHNQSCLDETKQPVGQAVLFHLNKTVDACERDSISLTSGTDSSGHDLTQYNNSDFDKDKENSALVCLRQKSENSVRKHGSSPLDPCRDDRGQFVAPSLYPLTCIHDMSFWEDATQEFDEKQYFSVIRDVALDNVNRVDLIDSYTEAATGRKSRCYRLTFQSVDQVLSYDTTWKLQSMIRLGVEKAMNITLR